MAKTCEEYVINELENTKDELHIAQQKNIELNEKYNKALKIIEIFKKKAKVDYGSVWVHICDEKDKEFLIKELDLKEEEKPNE